MSAASPKSLFFELAGVTPEEARRYAEENYLEAVAWLEEQFPDLAGEDAPWIFGGEKALDAIAVLEAKESQANCGNCPGYESCPNIPRGHSRKVYTEQGRVEVVVTHKCQAKRQAEWSRNLEYTMQKSQLPPLLQAKGFRNFVKTAHPHAAKMAKAAEESAKSDRSLVLAGNYGCGKSHLAAAILNNVLRRQKTGLYISVPEMIDVLRNAAWSKGEERPMKVLEGIVEVDVLVLDDLGKERPTAFASEQLFRIIDGRYTAQKQTIVTTNHTEPGTLAYKAGDHGEAICSRLQEMCGAGGWIVSQAPDYRRNFCGGNVAV